MHDYVTLASGKLYHPAHPPNDDFPTSWTTDEEINPCAWPQLILWLASGASNEGPRSRVLVLVPPFLGPGFWLGACWNRLVETVKTRKKREKTGKNGRDTA